MVVTEAIPLCTNPIGKQFKQIIFTYFLYLVKGPLSDTFYNTDYHLLFRVISAKLAFFASILNTHLKHRRFKYQVKHVDIYQG